MSLRDIDFQAVYRSDEDDLLKDFYLPALAEASRYDRAAGFFSAQMVSYAAQGLSSFVQNQGEMRLIFGGELLPEEFEAISNGYQQREILEKLGIDLTQSLSDVDHDLFRDRLNALSWLVATSRLSIKIALRPKGMYHEKIGIFRDTDGNQVVFQGSANETAAALVPELNFESINVFPSWRPELKDHFEPHIEAFDRIWRNESPNTLVVDFPEAAKQTLIKIAEKADAPSEERELKIYAELVKRGQEQQNEAVEPAIPNELGGNPFQLRVHQVKALEDWRNADFLGIFKLATGAGKTITAIYGAVKLYEALKSRRGKLFVLISAPYISLADQWVEVLASFGIQPTRCYESRLNWVDQLNELIVSYNIGARKFGCAVVVNRTLTSQMFIKAIANIDPDTMLFIGDECHHHYGENILNKLPVAQFRLGLSATPEHYIDEEANQRLFNYYGDIVSEYDLEQALSDGVLTPYDYFVYPIRLNDEEVEKYTAVSARIAPYVQKLSEGKKLTLIEQQEYLKLLRLRASILGNAEEKLEVLNELLRHNPPEPLTLFYSGDGGSWDDDEGDFSRQITKISSLLDERGWKSSRFTSQESPNLRRTILDSFKVKAIDAIVAIRCLDEGIDIPACRQAYILASSRNPREFVQRRGRILRQAPGKEKAIINDFFVYIPKSSDAASHDTKQRLAISELDRIRQFSSLARNLGTIPMEVEQLVQSFGIDPEVHAW